MNILIPNSWLKDYLSTNATPQQFAIAMSLASVSIERIEKIDNDFVYDIEVTTNRPDLMSIVGIAREAAAILPLQGYKAEFLPPTNQKKVTTVTKSSLIKIQNDSSLVNRIVAVVMEVNLKESPKIITDRLSKTGIRSINSVVDVTNYVMRQMGHPSHVFDYDRLVDHTLIIRKSKKGEKIITLDEKEYELPGNDIVADNGRGEIIDLLGIMGTANSVVVKDTKRVVLFLDNNNPDLLRKTSMNLGIRTEAAVLNEKGVDPELMIPTLLAGVKLLEENANGKVISEIIDIYPNTTKTKVIKITSKKINGVIGIEIPQITVVSILKNLGFGVEPHGEELLVSVPSIRANDIEIAEDIIEEIARVYGYHKIPNKLPFFEQQNYFHQDTNEFFWIKKIKDAFLYWGFCETYTYSMVSEELFDGPIENAVALKNPLTDDRAYMRNQLTPSLLSVANENKKSLDAQLFEIANIYIKKTHGAPDEILHLAAVLKIDADFYEGKGIVERVFEILGLKEPIFQKKDEGIAGTHILYKGTNVGFIEYESGVVLEINLSHLLPLSTSTKKYKEAAKFPAVVEDLRVEIAPHYSFSRIEKAIRDVDEIIESVTLLDVYQNKKTFRVTFRNAKRTLMSNDITPIREKIHQLLASEFKAILG